MAVQVFPIIGMRNIAIPWLLEKLKIEDAIVIYEDTKKEHARVEPRSVSIYLAYRREDMEILGR